MWAYASYLSKVLLSLSYSLPRSPPQCPPPHRPSLSRNALSLPLALTHAQRRGLQGTRPLESIHILSTLQITSVAGEHVHQDHTQPRYLVHAHRLCSLQNVFSLSTQQRWLQCTQIECVFYRICSLYRPSRNGSRLFRVLLLRYLLLLPQEPSFSEDVICDATNEWVLHKYDKSVASQCKALMSLCKKCSLTRCEREKASEREREWPCCPPCV